MVKELWKSVIIWPSYGQKFGVSFSDSQCKYTLFQKTRLIISRNS